MQAVDSLLTTAIVTGTTTTRYEGKYLSVTPPVVVVFVIFIINIF